MKIPVTTIEPDIWDDGDISIVVNGTCNHATNEPELYDPTDFLLAGTPRSVLVCMKCSAWCYTDDDYDGWHDTITYDEEPIKTSRKLVLR